MAESVDRPPISSNMLFWKSSKHRVLVHRYVSNFQERIFMKKAFKNMNSSAITNLWKMYELI